MKTNSRNSHTPGLLTLEAILDRSDDIVISQMAKDAIAKATGGAE